MGFLSRYFDCTERLSPIFGKKNGFGGPEMVLLFSCKKKKFHGLFSSDVICFVVCQLLMGQNDQKN